MKLNIFSSFFLSLLIPVAIAGCGSDAGTNQFQVPVSSLERAQPCIDCHYANVSPGTGKSIPGEYRMSGHAAKNGAACPDCHAPSANHPLTCAGCHGGQPFDIEADLTRNPDEAGKCDKCHGLTATRAPLIQGRFSSEKRFNHYTTGSGRLAAYVTPQNEGKCRSCHNPHDNRLIPQFREWAESGHGRTDPGRAFTHLTYDMKIKGSRRAPIDLPNNAYTFTSIYADAGTRQAYCVRCHTATGFINYVQSGFRNISSWGGYENPPQDKKRQVLYCNACHYSDQNGRSYGYTVRNPPPAMGFYNYTSKATGKILMNVQYPDLNQSNNCMNCHVGWNSGPEIKQMAQRAIQNGYTSFFKDTASLSSHYYAAGATVFKSIGYEYDGRNYNDEDEFKHKLIGRDNYRDTTTKGPCVMCHIFPGRMSFLPVERVPKTRAVAATATSPAIPFKPTGKITKILSPTCAKCHDGSFRAAWTPESLFEKKEGFQAALDALIAQLNLRKTKVPKSGRITANWGTEEVFGASFNHTYLLRDFGAFAHNSRYVKRLIYDSIDYVDDIDLNYSVGRTLDNLTPAPAYRDKAKGYLLKNGATTSDANERM